MKCSRYITRYLGKYKSLGAVKFKTLFYLPPPLFLLIYFNPHTLSTFLRYKSSTRLSSPLQKRDERLDTHFYLLKK